MRGPRRSTRSSARTRARRRSTWSSARAAPLDPAVELLLPTGDVEYLQGWWIEQMLGDPATRLRERVCLLWHDHFATSHTKVGDVHLMHGQNHLWRTGGLGDFRALLHAATTDPAMLVWLDGVENRAGRPNENHARELLELFGLGIGNYDERDVLAAARGLSGWRVLHRRARFVPARFDDGEKAVLGRRGRLDAAGVVDAVLAHEACPRWIASRLLGAYAGGAPHADATAELARELVAGDWDVGRALVHLVTRPGYLSQQERGSRIAGPVELVVRTVLETGARLAPVELARTAARMGQDLYRPPSVEGWDGGRRWIDSTRWIARQRFAATAAGAVDTEPADADALFERLLPDAPRPSWRAQVEGLAAGGADPDRFLLAAVLSSAEYQLQ